MSHLSTRQPPVVVRAAGRAGGFSLRYEDEGDDAMPTLVGYFAVFNAPTEIDSVREGQFMERVAPGAFNETIARDRSAMRVLFQHGADPQVGNKPLGPIRTLREDARGPEYEVPLLDTQYNRDLIPGLRAGLYGASFAFRVLAEDWQEGTRSSLNPNGLPERTLRQLQVLEFGPVTFPAYADATAGLRAIPVFLPSHRHNGSAERVAA